MSARQPRIGLCKCATKDVSKPQPKLDYLQRPVKPPQSLEIK